MGEIRSVAVFRLRQHWVVSLPEHRETAGQAALMESSKKTLIGLTYAAGLLTLQTLQTGQGCC